MSIVHTLLTFLMAFLVGNPVCCCASLLPEPEQPFGKEVSSCCGSPSKELPSDKVPAKPHQCPCVEKPSDLPNTDVAIPPAPADEVAPPQKLEQLAETFPRGPTFQFQPSKSHFAPPPPVRLLFQVFRL
ncbi:hypothetical protein AAFN60_07395 [Roseibacillus persicicus]|uniref:hypothetical protein n=1 Tax=Roseibacillus persicicus TaxID=454148 RepID=UPI00398B9834